MDIPNVIMRVKLGSDEVELMMSCHTQYSNREEFDDIKAGMVADNGQSVVRDTRTRFMQQTRARARAASVDV